MIDLNSNLKAIEKLIKIMKKNGVNELSCDWLNIKINHATSLKKKATTIRNKKEVIEETDEETLDNHTLPPSLPNEPWLDIDESVIANYEITGKVGN